jgi:hypothetical protein
MFFHLEWPAMVLVIVAVFRSAWPFAPLDLGDERRCYIKFGLTDTVSA